MQYAGDIAASEDTNQLYVLDLNPGNAVWKVDPASGQASKFITFTAKEQAVGISVHGGRILLTGKLFSKLFVYDANSGSSLSTVTVSLLLLLA
jgi:DNA-binding beta-propeller fold protein YncE